MGLALTGGAHAQSVSEAGGVGSLNMGGQNDALKSARLEMALTGAATLQLGGTLIDKKGTGVGEFVGSRLDGGSRHPLGPGDVIHIPATIPHAFLVPKGKHITYVLLKFPEQ